MKKKRKTKVVRHRQLRAALFLLYSAIVGLLILTSCQNSRYNVTEPARPVISSDAGNNSPGGKWSNITDLGNGCYSALFTQPTRDISKKLDILFVPDTSNSIFKERESAADGIDHFVAALPADTDFRVAAILAHGSTSPYAGRLYSSSHQEPEVLDSKAMSQDQIRSGLRAKLVEAKGDRGSDGGEMGMFTILEALKTKNLKLSQSLGFFRNDAALAVVFVADENDICAAYPKGVAPVPDPNGQEPLVKTRDCKSVTAQHVYSSLKNLKRGMPITMAAIVYTPESIIRLDDKGDAWSMENEIGYGYLDLVRLSNGLAIDITKGQIAERLSSIGKLAALKLSVRLEFPLAHRKINPKSIEVKVDGQQSSEFRFVPETNQVNLIEAGAPGSKVEVKYCGQ
jgi:hypothetical protein